MTEQRLRFGVFLPPYHALEDNPHLALHRDLWLAEHVDRLGFEEMWVGEHHSAAFETIGAPEMFIATAAERTRNIRLGTGVVSLPYHTPLMLAERINYLDHVTRGRVMFGVGPGALPSDAMMQGIPVERLRPRMDEAISALDRLLRGEVVNQETEWFTLKDARLQMMPFSQPRVEMAVASLVSPSGATAAGKHGLGLLSFQALGADAFKTLASNWAMAEETAAKHGQSVDRSKWRLVIQVHLAESREEAVRDCRFGLEPWIGYFRDVAQLPIVPEGLKADDLVETYADLDVAVIGTPDDAIATIEKLQEETGGFGCIMLLAHNWANTEATAKSYELFARYVMPHFQNFNVNRKASMDWVIKVRSDLAKQTEVAMQQRFAQHEAETKGEG
ncbi:MAG: LLM class flavin-dependent oxidoreductase [Novosphingobium sp.]|nr:LLM class flavin-dependent oxidoreductase [Novosphingobium sp.]